MRELPLRAARQQWPARALAAFCLAIEAAQMPNALAALQPKNTISASARSQAKWSTFSRSPAPNCYGDVSSLLPKGHRNRSFEGLISFAAAKGSGYEAALAIWTKKMGF